MHLWLHWNGAEFNFCHDVIINLRCVPFESVLNYILKINNSWTNLNVQTSAARRCAPLLQLVRYVNEASRTETKANTLIFISNNVSQYCGNQSERHFYFELYIHFRHQRTARASRSNVSFEWTMPNNNFLSLFSHSTAFSVQFLRNLAPFAIAFFNFRFIDFATFSLLDSSLESVCWNCFLELFFQGFVCSRWPLLNYLNLF